MNPHGENGSMGNSAQQQLGEGFGKQGNVELSGLETNFHSGNGSVVESEVTPTPLPCGKPRPPIERVGATTAFLDHPFEDIVLL